MPALSPSAWAAVRAEWEVGLGSARALAARHGVSEKAIRKRIADRCDPWRRDPEAAERARERGREAALCALARGRSAAEVRIDNAALAARRDASETELADAIAEANRRHLTMAGQLRNLFDAMHGLLADALVGDAISAATARAKLLGRGGSLASAILLQARLATAIQTIEGKALGMDEPKPGGGGRTHNSNDGSAADAAILSLDITRLTTEQLALLAEAAALLDRTHGDEGGLPLPPRGPG